MPEVLGSPPSPRTALFWNGTAWQWALVDAAGHLQLDVVTSGLPAGAATAANQATMITALQLIDDLRNALDSVGTDELDVNVEASVLPTGAATQATLALCLAQLQLIEDMRDALQSVATDRLIVRGEDQLFSVTASLGRAVEKDDVGVADYNLTLGTVPAGVIWVVTDALGYHVQGGHTRTRLRASTGGTMVYLENLESPGARANVIWHGWLVLFPTEYIQYRFEGCAANDDVRGWCNGFVMTLET